MNQSFDTDEFSSENTNIENPKKELITEEVTEETPVVSEEATAATPVTTEETVEETPVTTEDRVEETPVVTEEKSPESEEILHEAQSLSEIKDEKMVSLDNFNWDEYEEGTQHYTDSEYKELEKIYSGTLTFSDDTKIIEGQIVAKTDRDFIIDIGAKSEGVISINEFRYNPDYKI